MTTASLPRTDRYAPFALAALRIVAGVAEMQHGGQKLFGWFADPSRPGPPIELMSRFGAAGVIEFGLGLLVAVGLFTRPAAFVLSGEMAFAYFLAHAPMGFWPIQNHGELAVLFCFIFLAISTLGPGRPSLDALRERPGR